MNPKRTQSIASDNNSGIHPDILHAISEANKGHVPAYGGDDHTNEALAKFHEHFGAWVDVFMVFTGTSANVLGLKSITRPFHSIICTESAHLNSDECGAPENYIGCKLISVPDVDGKLNAESIKPYIKYIGFEHHVQPKVLSITQPTELGTVYSIEELRALTRFAHTNNLIVHMDGARLCNAAAHLNCNLKAITTDVGIDLMSFGGTKNGMLCGEAVIFFKKRFSKDFKFIRKQGMQLAAKMRFLSSQFNAYLSHDLWLINARRANEMAKFLARETAHIKGIRITRKVQSNAVFAFVAPQFIPDLQKRYPFYVWNPETSEVRWMTSFDTAHKDIRNFVQFVKSVVE